MQRREKLETGLFEALRKYSPREGNDPLENFITEGFAWLLNKYPEFGEFFLQYFADSTRKRNFAMFRLNFCFLA